MSAESRSSFSSSSSVDDDEDHPRNNSSEKILTGIGENLGGVREGGEENVEKDEDDVDGEEGEEGEGQQRIQKAPSVDSATANEIEDFFGAMENELEEILSSQESAAPGFAPSIPYQPQVISETEIPREYLAEDGWTLYYSGEGYPYYYNSITQESAWASVQSTSDIDDQNQKRLTPTVDGREDGVDTGEDSNVIKSLEGINPSPNKLPLNSVKKMNEMNETEEKEKESGATSNQSSLLSVAKGSLSVATATAATAATYGKSFLAVAATTATTLLKSTPPTSSSSSTTSSSPTTNQPMSYQIFLHQPDSIEVTISARSSSKVPFILKKGYTLFCTIFVKDYDLGVALRERKMTDGGGVEVDLHPLTRYSSGTAHNLADTLSLQDPKDIQSTRHIILVFDNSYSTLRSKSCIYQIRQIESSSLNNLLDIPDTIQFNEFIDDHKGNDGDQDGDGESELDHSFRTEQSTDDERDGDEPPSSLNRVELIPLSVATHQKLKVSERNNREEDIHLSDFQIGDDNDNNDDDNCDDNDNENLLEGDDLERS